ncbi:MAG TPA: MBL fold metallo-hydrolase [Stellaceae bacterium]|jgi:glyoxylase-like metal-dependent hydrolase (beta-lactamase superfamily II)|nr:MBL fold metallo-hydrolase [Stellaceae bacterium]
MKRLAMTIVAVAALAFAVGAPRAWAQQQDLANAQITTKDLGQGAYMLLGPGGNITIVTASDGILMVDAEFPPVHDKVRAAITAVSQQPIKAIVNTHYHPDHTSGDAAFIKEGVTVIAHENVKKRLLAGYTNGLTGNHTNGLPPDAVPTKTYSGNTGPTLKVNGRTAKVGHIANAHTDGDSYVYFPEINVLATGDILVLGRYPNIDFANGGNIKGMIAGIDRYLKIANFRTQIVPGHGPLAHKADLVTYRAFLIEARDRVAKLIKAGKSEQEAVAAHVFADWDAKLNANDQASANFTRVVYNSLKPPKAK